jgi:hypothetical protein
VYSVAAIVQRGATSRNEKNHSHTRIPPSMVRGRDFLSQYGVTPTVLRRHHGRAPIASPAYRLMEVNAPVIRSWGRVA